MKATLIELVEYELASSWLAGNVPWPWLQEKLAEHYIRRVKRKIKNVEQFRHLRTLRDNGATEGHLMWAIRQHRKRSSTVD